MLTGGVDGERKVFIVGHSHGIEETVGFFGDHGDAFFVGWRDHGEQGHLMGIANILELSFFFVWQVEQDQAGNVHFLAEPHESLSTIGEDHVGIGYKNERHFFFVAQFLHEVENAVGGGAGSQRADVGTLHHRSFGGRVGERNAQGDGIRTSSGHFVNHGSRCL